MFINRTRYTLIFFISFLPWGLYAIPKNDTNSQDVDILPDISTLSLDVTGREEPSGAGEEKKLKYANANKSDNRSDFKVTGFLPEAVGGDGIDEKTTGAVLLLRHCTPYVSVMIAVRANEKRAVLW